MSQYQDRLRTTLEFDDRGMTADMVPVIQRLAGRAGKR
jgi:hypothetical protein